MTFFVTNGMPKSSTSLLAFFTIAPIVASGPALGALVDKTDIKSLWGSVTTLLILCYGYLALRSVYSQPSMHECLILTAILVLLHSTQETIINCVLADQASGEALKARNVRLSFAQNTASVLAPAIIVPVFSWSMQAATLLLLVFSLSLLPLATKGVAPVSRKEIDVDDGKPSAPPETRATSPFTSIKNSPTLSLLLLVVFFNNVSFGIMSAVFPILALTERGFPASRYGLLQSTMSLSTIIAIASIGSAGAKVSHLKLSGVSLFIKLVGFICFASLASLPWTAVSVAIIGFGSGIWNTTSSTILLASAPQANRGAVLATYRSIAFAGSPVGSLLTLFLIFYGASFTAWFCVLGFTVSALAFTLRFRALKKEVVL